LEHNEVVYLDLSALSATSTAQESPVAGSWHLDVIHTQPETQSESLPAPGGWSAQRLLEMDLLHSVGLQPGVESSQQVLQEALGAEPQLQIHCQQVVHILFDIFEAL
jgi:hypothetical protein